MTGFQSPDSVCLPACHILFPDDRDIAPPVPGDKPAPAPTLRDQPAPVSNHRDVSSLKSRDILGLTLPPGPAATATRSGRVILMASLMDHGSDLSRDSVAIPARPSGTMGALGRTPGTLKPRDRQPRPPRTRGAHRD